MSNREPETANGEAKIDHGNALDCLSWITSFPPEVVVASLTRSLSPDCTEEMIRIAARLCAIGGALMEKLEEQRDDGDDDDDDDDDGPVTLPSVAIGLKKTYDASYENVLYWGIMRGWNDAVKGVEVCPYQQENSCRAWKYGFAWAKREAVPGYAFDGREFVWAIGELMDTDGA